MVCNTTEARTDPCHSLQEKDAIAINDWSIAERVKMIKIHQYQVPALKNGNWLEDLKVSALLVDRIR